MHSSLKYLDKGRHATWLELFFDLVFVAAIGVIGHTLAEPHDGHFSLMQLPQMSLQFIPIWWVWAQHTMYCNRFDTDSKPHRLATLSIMFIVVMIPTFGGYNIEQHYTYLVVAYTAIRLIIAGLYWVSQHKFNENNFPVLQYALWSVVGAGISLSSIFFDGMLRYAVFFAGIIFDWLMPLVMHSRLKKIPVHIPHLVERTGLLIIILMGETVISLVKSLQVVDWNSSNITAAMAGFVLLGAMWWIYFDSFHNLERAKRSLTGNAIIYSHLILCLGVLIMAAVVRYAIVQDIDRINLGIIATIGMTLFYIGKQIPYYILFPNMRRELIINSLIVISVTVISYFLPRMEWVLIGITLGLFYYVYANMQLLKNKDVSEYVIEE